MAGAQSRHRLLLLAAGAVTFLVVASLNSGGYRYGASDQAFYIPAILKQLDPALFPHDTGILEAQARYFVVDELVAAVMRATGWSIETCFALGYVLTAFVLYAALWQFGSRLFRSSLAVWTFIAAETLRHRITRTGVNTLEGYFHPRVLVFAIGVWSISLYLRGRPLLALATAVAAGLLHPTMAAFFVVLLVPAIWVTDPPLRRTLGIGACAGIAAAAWLLLEGPMRGALEPMAPAWRELLASKDYLFPVRDWEAGAWLANLGTAAVAIGGLIWRQRRGIAVPRERGLLAGTLALTLGFLITLPAVTAGSALFVQLQITRAFWLLDLVATAMVASFVDRPAGGQASRRGWRTAIAILVVLAAVGRGAWIGFVERRGRPLVAVTLPDDAWTGVIRWAEAQPAGVQFLADPGHAWKFGTPLRYSGRDVFLEEVKDVAMALYSWPGAERIIDRRASLGDFASLDAARATALAGRFRLDYLIVDRDLDLPLVHREGPFRIYALRQALPPGEPR